MKKLLWTTFAAILVGGAPTVTAQDRVTPHEFDDADLVAADRSPLDVSCIVLLWGGPPRSLIRPRTSFARDLLKSVDNL